MTLLETLQSSEWVLYGLSAVLIGMAKSGLVGAATFAIPVMATIFGAQASTGIVLPMLITADIVAVIYYRRDADWRIVAQLLPWTLVGVGVGVFVGDLIPEEGFRFLLAAVVLLGLGLMAWREFFHRDIVVPRKVWIAAVLGVAAGFATMVGNAAGPLMILYLLAMGFQKNQLIGTGAWFFFVVNLMKVPFHVVFWKTISAETLLLNVFVVPVVVAGVFLGLWIVKRVPERGYRYFILISTTIISVRLFF